MSLESKLNFHSAYSLLTLIHDAGLEELRDFEDALSELVYSLADEQDRIAQLNSRMDKPDWDCQDNSIF